MEVQVLSWAPRIKTLLYGAFLILVFGLEANLNAALRQMK
jgi:hypothetical protein